MERGEDEAIDSSNNQDLASEGGHLGGSEEEVTTLGQWVEGGSCVHIHTVGDSYSSRYMCLCVGNKMEEFLRVNESGQLKLLAGSSRYLGAGGRGHGQLFIYFCYSGG